MSMHNDILVSIAILIQQRFDGVVSLCDGRCYIMPNKLYGEVKVRFNVYVVVDMCILKVDIDNGSQCSCTDMATISINNPDCHNMIVDMIDAFDMCSFLIL